MELGDFIEVGLKAVAALGEVGVVAAAVAKTVSNHNSKKWLQNNQGELSTALETHRAELAKETEAHKLTLKRQELMFARELEAADAFMGLWRKVWPQFSRPDMDWHEACADVAERLGTVERLLEDYLEQHSVAISVSAREVVEQAQSEAASEKFFDNSPGNEPPKSALTAAENVLDAMRDARDTILNDLRR